MKSLIIIGLLCLCMGPLLHSQDQKLIDSLENKLSQCVQDTSRIPVLQKLFLAYVYNDSAKAMDYAQQCLAISDKAGYTKGTGEAYINIGVVLENYGDISEAMGYYGKARDIFHSIGDKRDEAGAYLNIGNINYYHGNLEEARQYFSSALHIFEESGDKQNAAACYINIGFTFSYQGNMPEAIKAMNSSLKIYEDLSDSLNMAVVWKDLATIYKDIGNYPQALDYYLDAMKILEKQGSERNLTSLYINLGVLYYYMGNTLEAMHYYTHALEKAYRTGVKNQLAIVLMNIANVYADEGNPREAVMTYLSALDIYKEMGDVDGMAGVYLNLGYLYEEQEKYKEALDNCEKAISIYTETGNKPDISIVYNNLGNIYFDLENYPESRKNVNLALQNAKEADYLRSVRDSYELLAKLDSVQGNYKGALENYKLSVAAQDSLLNEENVEKMTKQKMQFEFDKQNELARVEQEKKDVLMQTEMQRQKLAKRLSLISGSAILVISILLLILFRQKALRNKIIADQKIRQLEEEKKLLAARFLLEGEEKERKRIAQELHDGLGVLLSVTKMQFSEIKTTIPGANPVIDKAFAFLEQASGDVRRISHNMMPGLLTKLGLYDAVEDLFDSISDTEQLEALCEIDGSRERIPENKEIMLYRIIQEMVNNTVRHAKATKIRLNISTFDNHLELRYADNGKGFNTDDTRILQSLGLQSIQSRVHYLDGTLALHSAPGNGTSYTIEVPVQ
jgi:two-component system, NarL family, sensor kinase